MLWHIVFVFMSHSLLVPVGLITYHESLCGDKAVVCLFNIGTFFIMLFSCLFSIAGPLSVGGKILA